MNSSATSFLRACRARAPATTTSQAFLRTTHSKTSSSSSLSSSIISTSRTKTLSVRHGATLGHRAFSTTRTLNRTDSITESHSSPSDGLEATILGTPKSSSDDINNKQNNDYDSPTSTTTSSPSSTGPSYDVALLPTNLTSTDLSFLVNSPSYTGTVTRINSMDKTVRVSRNILTLHVGFQKYYTRATHELVHDAHNLLEEGDVVRYGEFPPSLRSRRDEKGQIVVRRSRPRDRNGVVKELGVRHMLREIITPFGVPLGERTGRVVGGEPGRWKGTEGEVRRIAVRQNRTKVAPGKKLKKLKKKTVVVPSPSTAANAAASPAAPA